MNEFYKKIKEHQSFNTDHEIPEDAWSSFTEYKAIKDEEKKHKRGFFYWPYVAGLIGLLVGGVSLVTSDKVAGLGGIFYAVERDTVYITKYIEIDKEVGEEQRNTIQNLELQLAESRLELASAKKNLSSVATNFNTLQNKHRLLALNFDEINESLLSLQTNGSNQTTSIKADVNKTFGEGANENINADKESSVGLRNILNTELLVVKNELKVFALGEDFIGPFNAFLPTKRGGKRPFYQYLTPKTLSVGADFDLGFPSDFYATTNSSIVQGGLLISSHFTPVVRGNIAYHYGAISSEDKDPLANPLIPEIPPVEDGTIKEVKISRTVSNVSVGLEYILYKGYKWRPFVGVSYGLNIINYPKFIYEYDTPQGEIYQQLETKSPVEYSALYRVNTGIEYHLWKALDVQLQLGYQYSNSFKSSTRIKTRFLYHF